MRSHGKDVSPVAGRGPRCRDRRGPATAGQGGVPTEGGGPLGAGAGLDALPADGIADGKHRLTIEAVDRAGNVTSASHDVRIDNAAPSAPMNVAVDGGEGWR